MREGNFLCYQLHMEKSSQKEMKIMIPSIGKEFHTDFENIILLKFVNKP
jgi:uncharacterized protein YihD (DUF1040 family)